MTDFKQYHGFYYFMGLVLDIQSDGDQLIGGMPGIPAGYEVLLDPIGEDLFRTKGGPIDGSPIQFLRDRADKVTSMKVGTYNLSKIDSETLATLPVVERLLPPELELTPEKQGKFEKLLQTSLEDAQGQWIDYELPYPKYEFVQYSTTRDQIIFHGSNNTEIENFQPIRKSLELRDETGRGNVQGVYGTHDGLWAMFFAIVDRQRLQGSIRNGVMYFQNRATGEQIAAYNFSINQEQLDERPYTAGALYFFPRETFTRLQLTQESYANEWASEQPVKPLAKLHLQPDDFPFLDQIVGHDDTELLRLNELSQEIHDAAVSASIEGDQFEVTLRINAAVLADLDEFIQLQRMMMPAAQFEEHHHVGFITLTISSLPPALQDMLKNQYQDFLV
jgi:hypothetical protein